MTLVAIPHAFVMETHNTNLVADLIVDRLKSDLAKQSFVKH